MILHLSSNHRQQLLDWAMAAGNDECCGILHGEENRVTAVTLARNIAADPARHFEIDPAVLISAHKGARTGGPALLGFFHSHPNGNGSPSKADIALASPERLFWLIIASEAVTAWQPIVTGGRVTGFSHVSLAVEG